MITAASVTALFLRGFRVKSFAEQLKSKDVITPNMSVWLIVTPDYNNKMDAYKDGIAAAHDGYGVYILPDDEQWTWVAGVYNTESDAKHALQQSIISEQTEVRSYQIKGKKFAVDAAALEPCRQVLSAVQNVYNLLIELRTAMQQTGEINNLQIEITTQYNQIKSGVEALQSLNSTIQSDFIATIIYTANQNILGLQNIVGITNSLDLSTINNALLKTIFSLDNF